MTPCEKLGYKVGDIFTVIYDDNHFFEPNNIVYLVDDDASECLLFSKQKGNKDTIDDDTGYLMLSEVSKIETYSHDINTTLQKLLNSDSSSLEDTFKIFVNKIGGCDVELGIKKGKYTLYFDTYEFDGDEARIRKVIEMLTELHIKG